MAQHSMWLTGELRGDNLANVEWECGSCSLRIGEREDAIRHVRTQHQEGTIRPRLSQIGKELAKMHFYLDASERLAKELVDLMEQSFCKAMGAELYFVSHSDITSRSLNLIPNNETLFKTVKGFINNIRHKVEQKEGYISLTNSRNKARVLRSEREIQLALQDWLEPHCKYSNINLTREPSTGRGSLDFKFSVGADLECLLEVKLMSSSNLQHGLEIQLPTYLLAKKAGYGIYLPIGIDKSSHDIRINDLNSRVEEINATQNLHIEIMDIRAWKQEPASVAKESSDPKRYGLI